MATLPNITPEIIKAYQDSIANVGSSATAKRKTVSLKKFFDWAANEGKIENNPLAPEKIPNTNNQEPNNYQVQNPKRNNTRVWATIGLTLAIVILIFLLTFKLKFPIPFITNFAQEANIQTQNQLSDESASGQAPEQNPSDSISASSAGNGAWNLYAKLKLADSTGTPKVGAMNLSFKIYDKEKDGNVLYTSTPQSVTTDSDGSALISIDNVPSDLFFGNNKLFLEPVLASESASVRIPISTANTPANLNGYYPADPLVGAGNETVPVIDANGSLSLASESPAIKAKKGNFLLEGQTVTIKAADGSGGNIEINPDANGIAHFLFEGNKGNFLNAQAPNLTSGSLYYGMVPNSATGYDLIKLQSGSPKMTTRFSVSALGNTYVGGDLNVKQDVSTNGVDRLTSTGTLENITGYSQNSGNFTVSQNAGDFASITKNASALSDVLNLTLDERGHPNSTYSTLTLNRYNGAPEAAALHVAQGNAIFDGQLQLGRFDANPTSIGQGSLVFNTGDNKVYVWDGTSWTAVGSGSANFDAITGGTNTSAAMVIGSGASLSTTGTGTIAATDLTCTGCVSNSELANSAITIGTSGILSGGGSVALGGTLNLTATEADTLNSVTTRGATTANSITVGNLTDNGLTASKAVFTDGSKQLTSTGTLGSDQGGTGFGTYTVGDLLYADTTTSLAKLNDAATGNVLISGGAGVAPSYGKVVLGTHTSGNYVSTITGTANQITASSATGDVTLSIPSDFRAPGTVNAVSGLYTGAGAGTIRVDASGNFTGSNATFTGSALDFGATNATRTINIGTGTAADTINIGTGGTTADVITIGNTSAATTVNLTKGASGNITLTGFDCTGFSNGGKLTTDASGNVTCASDTSTSGGGGTVAWDAITDPAANLILNMAAHTTAFDWTGTGAITPYSLNFTNNAGSSTTQNFVTLTNAATTQTGDVNTESLLHLDNADTSATGSTIVDNAILITNSGGITNGITDAIDASGSNIVNALNIGSNNIAGTNFNVTGSNGNVTSAGNVAVNGGSLTTTSTTANLFTGATTLLNIGPTGANGSLTFSGGSSDTGCTLDGTTGNFTCSGNITTTATSGIQGFWAQNSGAIYPINNSVDFLLGDTSTGSAKFAFKNVLTGTPTATISGSVANVATYLDGNGNLSTTNAQGLTLGSSTTGNVVINSRGSSALTANGANLTTTGTFTLPNSITLTGVANYLESSAGFSVGGGTTYYFDGSGNINANAGTFAGNVAVNGGSLTTTSTTANLFAGATTLLNIGPASNVGSIALAGGSGDTGCTLDGTSGNLTCSGDLKTTETNGTQGWWQRNLGVVSPTNIGDDLIIGATATASATFQVSSATGNITSTGDLALNGSDITSTSTGTGTVFNTNITTLNLGGAATTMNIGPTGNGASSIIFSGGSGDTGCTLSGSVGSLTCSGFIASGGVGQFGSTTATTYSRFGSAATGHGLSASNDVLIGGKLELDGFLYLDSNQIFNSAGTASIILTSSTTTDSHTLSGSWLVDNGGNVGEAALIVNQTKGGDIFTASASGTPKFTIDRLGDATASGNITMGGQLQFGRFGATPTALGAGSEIFNTTTNTFQCNNGTSWYNCDATLFNNTNASVANGSYITVTHNLATNNLLSNGWVLNSSTGLWENVDNTSHTVKNALANEWNTASAAGVIRTDITTSNLSLSSAINTGTGADGAITVSATTNVNTTNLISGRTCTDGGDMVNYSVSSLTSTTAVLSTTPSYTAGSPSASCLYPGDEVLLINLAGISTATGNVGNYETLKISAISGTTITFTTGKTKFYGNNATDDTNIGTTTSNQRVMLQRVPNYTNVTVNNGFTLTPSGWNGTKGGVLFFRASGSLTVAGTINNLGGGFTGGTGGTGGGTGGDAFCASPGGGAGGSGGSGAAGTDGTCGGGGGRNGLGSTGLGGAGGGGGGNTSSSSAGGGGGGGGGIGGHGTGGTGSTSSGSDGGTNASGNAGTAGAAGGGGGGSYGDSSSQLLLGSGGGAGGRGSGSGGGANNGAAGGQGGGIIYIAANTITVSGSITANGNVGSNGSVSSGGSSGNGGGGGGGTMIISGNTMTLGSSLVTASGGASGTGGTNAGGTGGNGFIGLRYATSLSGTTSPSASSTFSGYNYYGVFHSPVISTPNSYALESLRWESTPSAYGKIEFQTRTGNSTNPTDGTWEAWKPATNNTNYMNLLNTDTSASYTGTNATVSNNSGGITRNVDMFEDEDEATATNITKIVNTSAGAGYAEATVNNGNLSNYDYITAWVYATASGTTLKLGFGESAATEQEQTVKVDATNTWQKVYWDISNITSTSRDAVTKFRITNLNSPWNTFYIDQVRAEKLLTDQNHAVISSTPNNYFQYRVVFTTTNTAYQPSLNNVYLVYNDGFKLVQADTNNVRLYNYSGQTQQLQLNVTGAGTAALANPWTDGGSYLYPTGYESLRVYDGSGVNYLSLSNSGTDAQLGWNGTAAINIDSSGNVGIGTTTTTSKLNIGGTFTTSTASVGGLQLNPTINGSGQGPYGGQFIPTFTPPASTTITFAYGLTGIGTVNLTNASGNITNLYSGFFRNDSNTGNSGTLTNAWALYAAAPSYATTKPTIQYGMEIGNQGLSGITTSYGLYVDSQSGSTNNYAAIFAGGNVGIGTTAPDLALTVASSGQGISNDAYVANSSAAVMNFRKSRNSSIGSHTIVQSGDAIGNIFAYGSNGTDFDTAAEIKMAVDGTPGASSDMPGRIQFFTTPDGSATLAERMRIDNAGNVGIGDTSPLNRLSVQDNQATASAMIRNTSTTAATAGLAIRMDATTIDNTTRFINFMNKNGTIIGKISGNTATTVQYLTGGTDFAEFFTKDDPNAVFPTGTIMCQGINGVVACSPDTSSKIVGIVSATAGFVGGDEGPNKVIIALTGQVPVLMSPNSDNVAPGDLLTMAENGMAKKATGAGFIIGKAQKAWNQSSGQNSVDVTTAYIWADTNLALNSVGNLNISKDPNGNYALANTSNNTLIDKIGAFGTMVAANIKSGALTTEEFTTQSFNAFQGTIDHLLVSSGLVATNIQTKLISPLADGTDVTVKLGSDATPSGKLAIQNNSGDEVASIDSAGNATFSGIVRSQNIDEIQNLLTQVKSDQDLMKQSAGWNTNTATVSANLNTLAVADLYVTNQAAINSLSVAQNLAVGSDFIIQSSDNSINTISSPLKLQSLASAPIEIMAGLVTIDTHGNVNIAGDLFVAGKITTPELNAGLIGTESINATGSATFNSLIISAPDATVSGSVATSSAQTNSSIGKAVLPAGVNEITIHSSKVNSYSLVYVTPTSSTQNYVLYIKEKGDGYFVVGFDQAINVDVNFNWWVVGVQ